MRSLQLTHRFIVLFIEMNREAAVLFWSAPRLSANSLFRRHLVPAMGQCAPDQDRTRDNLLIAFLTAEPSASVGVIHPKGLPLIFCA